MPVVRMWRRVEGAVGEKQARYAAVSAVSVAVTQAVLILCSGLLGWSGAVSNLTAVSVGAVPSYTLNRSWAWGKTGKNHLWKEVVPFWTMALVGLALSTALAAVADRIWGTTLAVSLANLAAFGLLWVGKFMVLNLVLFKAPVDATADGAAPGGAGAGGTGEQPPITVC